MAQLINTSKTRTCDNCEGTGIDPNDATPDFVVAGADGDPREGCPICHGRGEVLRDDAVILETDDLEMLMKAAHKADDDTAQIVGADSNDLPDIVRTPPKGTPPSIEDRLTALEKASKAKG